MSLRPAVFLDRDGTIIAERSYLADPADVTLVPASCAAIRELKDAGYAVVVTTNQSGIARGLYTLDVYHAVAARLDEVLAQGGVVVDATYYCPHHPDAPDPCDCRKPGTGMHRRAAEKLGLDFSASFYVGDKVTDVMPAQELGGQGILVRTGYGIEMESRVSNDVWIAEDLAAASVRIVRESSR